MYDVISGRYEMGSILLTSNRAPSEWMGLFQDPLLGSAGLDRLVHNAYAIVISGASYRTHGSSLLQMADTTAGTLTASGKEQREDVTYRPAQGVTTGRPAVLNDQANSFL